MTEQSEKKVIAPFFSWYFGEIFKDMEEFFPLSSLCKIAGVTQAYFLKEAERRNIELWFKLSDKKDEIDLRLFQLSQVLVSDIKEEMDYLSAFSGDDFGSCKNWAPESYYTQSVGEPMAMDYLLLSFQDLRWHASGRFCIFMEGVREVPYENSADTEKKGAIKNTYQHYNFLKDDRSSPRVFIACKKQSEECDQKSTMLDEDRVQRFAVNELELYVEKIKFNELGCLMKLIQEMEVFKDSLLRMLNLEDMPFVDFPEKLFYIFVITCRNLHRTNWGEKIDGKMVENDLKTRGFNNKSAKDISSLITNTRTPSGDRKKFKKIAGVSEEESLQSLNVIGLFKAFKKHYNKKGGLKASEIAVCLTSECEYTDDLARKISPLIVGTDADESWKGYRFIIS